MKLKNSTTYKYITEGIKNTLRIWVREYQLIFRDAGVMMVIFAIPLLYPLIYSFIYFPEVVSDMPVAVVDLSHSADSRQIIRDLDATPELQVASQSISMDEAIRKLRSRIKQADYYFSLRRYGIFPLL